MSTIFFSIFAVLDLIAGGVFGLFLLWKLAVWIGVGLGIKVLMKHILLHKALTVVWQKTKKLFSRFKKGKGDRNIPPIIKE